MTPQAFKNEEFKKEKPKFYLLLKMLNYKDNLFLSDNKTYLLGRGKVGYPTWLWTKDNLEEEKVKEVEQLLKDYYLPEKENSFTCKKELYNYLEKDLEGVEDYFEMGFLSCQKLNEVKKAKGFLDHPNYSDKTLLATYWKNNSEENERDENLTYEKALEEVDTWLKDDKFYVWRNEQGKVVSFLNYTVEDDLAKLSHVYTPKEERCKGYCTTLVYEVTKKLLDQKLVPLLYTDYNYVPSNHTYKKVGYEDQGYLVNFKVRK